MNNQPSVVAGYEVYMREKQNGPPSLLSLALIAIKRTRKKSNIQTKTFFFDSSRYSFYEIFFFLLVSCGEIRIGAVQIRPEITRKTPPALGNRA